MTLPKAIVELGEKWKAKATEMHDWMQEAPKNAEGLPKIDGDELERHKKEVNEARIEFEKQRDAWLADSENSAALKSMESTPVGNMPLPGVEVKGEGIDVNDWASPYSGSSIGKLFTESEAFKEFNPHQRRGPVAELPIKALMGTKATLDETTGWAVQNVRLPQIVPASFRSLRVADLIPQGTTTGNAVTYMEETTATNAAAEVAEGAAKPESTLAFTERTELVQVIATILPVTVQLMEDVPAMESYVNSRLRFFVEIREDGQLLTGNGTAPNISGILDRAINTQAKGADDTPTAVYKAMMLVATTSFFDCDGAVFHPLDWQDIRTLKTADGIFIWGNPADAGPNRIWGLPAVITTAITQGTGLVGAFQASSMIFRRHGIRIAVSDSHSDFFAKNLLAVRAEERLTLAVFRPTGFSQITGI